MNSKGFWSLLQVGSIGLFAIAIVIGYLVFPGDLLKSWSLFLVLLLSHILEIPLAMKIGRDKKIPSLTVAMKTLLFGFTWWLPLKKGIIEG